MDERFDLVYRLLDEQLVDADGRRCGRVDDVELLGGVGRPLLLSGLLTGRGAYAARMPRRVRRLARRLFGDDLRGRTVRRIPWWEVDELGATVQLRKTAADLGLAHEDREWKRPLGGLPGG